MHLIHQGGVDGEGEGEQDEDPEILGPQIADKTPPLVSVEEQNTPASILKPATDFKSRNKGNLLRPEGCKEDMKTKQDWREEWEKPH